MKSKHLPRLWCALQGLLPLEACLAAQRAELAWPPEAAPPDADRVPSAKHGNRVAADGAKVNVRRRASVRTKS